MREAGLATRSLGLCEVVVGARAWESAGLGPARRGSGTVSWCGWGAGPGARWRRGRPLSSRANSPECKETPAPGGPAALASLSGGKGVNTWECLLRTPREIGEEVAQVFSSTNTRGLSITQIDTLDAVLTITGNVVEINARWQPVDSDKLSGISWTWVAHGRNLMCRCCMLACTTSLVNPRLGARPSSLVLGAWEANHWDGTRRFLAAEWTSQAPGFGRPPSRAFAHPRE